MQRRKFLQIAGVAGAALPFGSLLSCKSNPEAVTDDLFQGFVNPESKYRPYVRWWWNGDRVTKEEVIRELELMQKNGIGGVEINPIKWNERADAMNIPELEWGSSEWLDVVETAVKTAKEKGIVCDMIVGSGWPYGGEFVPRNEQCQMIALGTQDIEGGKTFTTTKAVLLDLVNPAFAFAHNNSVKELFSLRLAPAAMESFTEGTDLDKLVANDTISIDVPAGKHVLYILVKITGFAAVIQGALGANGPVINHYDAVAVKNYLDGFGAKLTGRLGKLDNYFRAFFTDSIELEGANWCSDMFEQFEKRRGYQLQPYFPYILFKTGEMGNAVKEKYGTAFGSDVAAMLSRVRYDFEITKHDVFQERFIKTFVDWCHAQGVQSRMQAYGMDCDAIHSGMMIDIPECETWIWGADVNDFTAKGGGRNYTNVNKFVASAAHFNNKQEISCEEMTNTGEIFNVSLERVKLTGDQSNLSGVTHSILHGFNYSPAEAPFPGWVRYGSYFNERNTWWPYFPLWSSYKTRISYVLQNSVMQADTAIMHPTADLASLHGFQRDPFPAHVYPAYDNMVWEAANQCGHGTDYVSEEILQAAKMGNGGMQFNNRQYHTLILIAVETITPATATALQQFADAGGKIIFIDKMPHKASGLQDEAKGAAITDTIQQLLSKHTKTTGIVPAPGEDMISWFKDVQQKFELTPYIQISAPVYHVSQNYYAHQDKDIFFFVNSHATDAHEFVVNFNANDKQPYVWDAETGERFLLSYNNNKALSLRLDPSASLMLVFDKADTSVAAYKPLNTKGLASNVIQQNWEVELKHYDGSKTSIAMPELKDLQDKQPDFSGSIVYTTSVNVASLKPLALLDLGKQFDVTVVEINGKPAGVRWYGSHLYDVSKLLVQGNNTIKIELITTLGRYAKSLVNNKATQEWSPQKISSAIGLTKEPVLWM